MKKRTFLLLSAALLIVIVAVSGCRQSKRNNRNRNASRPTVSNACDVLGLKSKISTSGTTIGKIINGTKCEDNSSPVVILQIQDATGVSLCTGSLITQTAVLTAAHCISQTVVSIQVGTSSPTVSSVSGSRVTTHPEVNQDELTGAFNHDVAVVHLASPLALPTLPIYSSFGLESKDEFAIFGYGKNSSGRTGSLYSGEMRVSEVGAQLFTAEFKGTGANTCNGDSGGPAIISSNKITGIVGITSTGLSEAGCRRGDLSTFASLSNQSNIDFIRGEVPNAVFR